MPPNEKSLSHRAMLAALIYELLVLYAIISHTHTHAHLQARVTPNPGYRVRYCGNVSIALCLALCYAQ